MRTSLTPEEAARVPDLFAEVSTLPPEQQLGYLERVCAGAPSLRAEVESLLGFRSRLPEFLARPVLGHGLEWLGLGAAGDLVPGTMLGEYRVVSLLGVGGMGEVYLAEDTVHGRQVALKLIGQGRAEEVRGKHFRHERKVLATLNHPHIARLYGSGTTPDGQAYLVMEYVEGERLDKFCEVGGLEITERLALFRKVCAAVSYAHQNLVVHRDLKPANIRVTPEGEPKLLDFGIAKLLDPEGTVNADPTVTMQGAMTPEYASPEQLKGEPITTASDAYSLGVVLYELLCGQRPFAHLKGRRPDELARAICEEEPPRPSTVVSRTSSAPAATTRSAEPAPATTTTTQTRPATWRRQLVGDLDNIVAKALQKEPARRYPSVSGLSEDLRRYGEGLPVRARRDTFAYRAGKFVRRNKAVVAAATLAVLALVTGLVVAMGQARRANRRFEDVRRLAHSILFEIEPKIANLSGKSIETRQLLVQRAMEYLDSLSAEAGNDADLRRELAVAYRRVGDIQGNPNYSNLGDLKGALASYQKSLGLLQAIVATNDRDWQARDELAKLHRQIGAALYWTDRKDEALAHYQAALLPLRRLVAEQPVSAELRRELVDVLMATGDWYEDALALPQALAAYHEALPAARAVAAAPPQVLQDRVNVARLLVRTSKVHKDAADYPAAMDDLAQAAAIVTPLAQTMPQDSSVQLVNWFITFNQLWTATKQGAPTEAVAFGVRTISLAQALDAANPGDASIEHDLACSFEHHAEALRLTRRWPEALAAARSAWEINTRLAARSPEVYTQDCISTRWAMGQAHLLLGDDTAATEDAVASQVMLDGELAKTPDDPDLRKMEVALCELEGDLCERSSQPALACKWFKRALAALQILTDKKQISDAEAPAFKDQRAKFTAKVTLADVGGKTTHEATRVDPGATAQALPTP